MSSRKIKTDISKIKDLTLYKDNISYELKVPQISWVYVYMDKFEPSPNSAIYRIGRKILVTVREHNKNIVKVSIEISSYDKFISEDCIIIYNKEYTLLHNYKYSKTIVLNNNRLYYNDILYTYTQNMFTPKEPCINDIKEFNGFIKLGKQLDKGEMDQILNLALKLMLE